MPVLRVVVAASEVELAADALWQAEPSAVYELTLDDGRVALTADVADPTAVAPSWGAEVVVVDGDDHLDAWRAWAQPVRAGHRFVIHPAWLPHPGTATGTGTGTGTHPVGTGATADPAAASNPDGAGYGPDDLVLDIDPGRAFGSGSHVSTRQVLAALEDHVAPGMAVLDVGCGSGVLAIGAARLGARGVLAIDIDPEAVHATAANAASNGVAVRVEASTTAVDALRATFDVVVANIGLRVLTELAEPIAARVEPTGVLVLAGLLDEQADRAVAAYPGLVEVSRDRTDGWTCVVLSSPA